MFHIIKEPPQWLLDGLYSEVKKGFKCHDCGVAPGKPHKENCDVARCLKCGGQRLSCDCKEGDGDIWEGIWPGIKQAYEEKMVCFDTATESLMFDLNRVALKNMRDKKQNV